jgi:hypothetical protein
MEYFSRYQCSFVKLFLQLQVQTTSSPLNENIEKRLLSITFPAALGGSGSLNLLAAPQPVGGGQQVQAAAAAAPQPVGGCINLFYCFGGPDR